MATQTTSSPVTLSSIIARYGESYLQGAKQALLYDQIAVDYTKYMGGMSMEDIMRASTVYVPFRSGMNIGTSTLSETTDLTPQARYDATASVTTTSRGEALQWSQALAMQAFSEFTASAFADLGQNTIETIESVIIDTALAGTWYDRYAASRSSLDAGTAAHNMSDSKFRMVDGMFQSMLVPGYAGEGGPEWSAITHPFVAHDIQESGKVVLVAEYQDKGIILNWELGKLGRFKIVSSPYAKVFFGAGANFDTDVDNQLNTASVRLAESIVTASDVSSDVAKGMFWTIGTIETGNTFYPMNERFIPLSGSTTTITLSGTAPNGGLRYDHSTSSDIIANDSVYSVLFAGPESLVRLYATDPANGDPDARPAPGVKGAAIVGPLKTGLAHQWDSLAWKWWGGYGRISEHRLYRYECTVSYEHST